MIWSLGFCCILKFCHPDNPATYKMRKKEFLEELNNNYKEVVKRVELSHFGLQKKVMFWAIKRKLFMIVTLLCFANSKRKVN